MSISFLLALLRSLRFTMNAFNGAEGRAGSAAYGTRWRVGGKGKRCAVDGNGREIGTSIGGKNTGGAGTGMETSTGA